MTNNSPISRTCLAFTILSLFMTAALSKAESTGSQSSQSKFRLTRSISGSKGHEQGGRYVMDDPRIVFKVPDDRQVLVYCEWEGVPGLHEFEGHWKNPADKVVAVSDFKLEVRERRCAGFFTLLLSETSETGLWTLEARVDGEPTGQHKFQIISSTDPAAQTATGPPQSNPSNPTNPANPTGPPPEQARQPLTESQIYELANAATVLIEKLDAKGVRIDTGSGFLVDTDVLLTAFQVIDGAAKLRVLLPDGRRLETQEALGWDQWQDLAFLKVDSGQKRFIKLSPNAESPVGSRVFTLAVSPEGARILVRCDIVGKNRFPQNGERINLNCSHPGVIGSSLLNEYGDLIGVVGGSLIPGLSSTKSYYGGLQLGNPTPGLLAVPVSSSSKPTSTQTTTNFQQLASGGVFTPALTRFENVQWGTLARRVETKPVPRPLEETHEFRSKEGTLSVFLTWQPKEKIKAATMIRIYDLEGRVLIESKPSKVDLKPGKDPAYSWWQAGISTLKPATYRVDVFLDASPVWRAFFRVRE
ncbi:MAG TPA: serine protease [Blastocatellia bacterium]|nr:serine protease [Blastocatellia bacterium]